MLQLPILGRPRNLHLFTEIIMKRKAKKANLLRSVKLSQSVRRLEIFGRFFFNPESKAYRVRTLLAFPDNVLIEDTESGAVARFIDWQKELGI